MRGKMDLAVNHEIRSPQDFVEILRFIKDAVGKGTLRQVKPLAPPFAIYDITAVAEQGPWPDYVEAYFESPVSGTRYRLTAEAYHGIGGRWEQL
jgi:hypothetical protein